jgi:hypothetical protein
VKRSALLRKTPLRAKSSLLTAKPLARVSGLKRTAFKRKPRRPKPGDEPLYKAWVKTLPCCVGGKRCGKADPHHLIDGNGDARKGMSQTAPDRYLLPMCRYHHELFHAGKGVFAGFDAALRLTFQEQECERLRSIWRDLNELEVLQEPARLAI